MVEVTSSKWRRCQWAGSSEEAVVGFMSGGGIARRTEGESVDVMTNAEGRLAADEGNDVEPKGDVTQSAATDVSDGGQGEALLLVAVDRGSGVFPTVVTAGFDLHEDEFAPIVGNDVDFQGVTTPVARRVPTP